MSKTGIIVNTSGQDFQRKKRASDFDLFNRKNYYETRHKREEKSSSLLSNKQMATNAATSLREIIFNTSTQSPGKNQQTQTSHYRVDHQILDANMKKKKATTIEIILLNTKPEIPVEDKTVTCELTVQVVNKPFGQFILEKGQLTLKQVDCIVRLYFTIF